MTKPAVKVRIRTDGDIERLLELARSHDGVAVSVGRRFRPRQGQSYLLSRCIGACREAGLHVTTDPITVWDVDGLSLIHISEPTRPY